uniref:S100 calcium binding protein A16 n=3 Tax=Corvus moneduloides TaxID=1196302 RepID=A0A8C3DC58_CORMO
MCCGMEELGSCWCVDGWICKPWDQVGILCLLPTAGRPRPRAPRGVFLGCSPNTSRHPKARTAPAAPGKEPGPAAGPCSLRPVPVLQSRGAISQVSPSLGTPWERQGGVGASLKTRLGRRDGCEVRRERRHRLPLPTAATDGHSGTLGGMQAAMGECTELEWAVQVLVNNFDKYSSRCCCCKNPRRISKKDFRKMLSCELNHMLTDTGNRRAADKLICDLDENKDGRISFEEYWTLIGGIASPIAQIIRQQEQSVKLTK